jgi:hypothetical protein
MSDTAEAIRDREDAKRPKPEPKKKTKKAEDAGTAEGQ